MLSFTYVYFFESRLFNGLWPRKIKKFSRYGVPRRLDRGVRDFRQGLGPWVLGPWDEKGRLAHGGLSLPFASFTRRFEKVFRPGEPVEVPRDDGFSAFGFGIEQPCSLVERRQVHSRGVDPGFMSGDRRRDLIPFAAQGRGDLHLAKIEHKMNIVKPNSE